MVEQINRRPFVQKSLVGIILQLCAMSDTKQWDESSIVISKEFMLLSFISF